MRIDMTFAAAHLAAVRLYDRESTPLSKLLSGNRVNDLNWWEASPTPEGFGSSRHAAALRLYLHLAEHAQGGLAAYRFPALFEFQDSMRRRPDKGWIKAALVNGVITAVLGDELVFELNPVGQNWMAGSPYSSIQL